MKPNQYTRQPRTLLAGALMLVGLAMSSVAAADLYCYGKVANVLLQADGKLMVVATEIDSCKL